MAGDSWRSDSPRCQQISVNTKKNYDLHEEADVLSEGSVPLSLSLPKFQHQLLQNWILAPCDKPQIIHLRHLVQFYSLFSLLSKWLDRESNYQYRNECFKVRALSVTLSFACAQTRVTEWSFHLISTQQRQLKVEFEPPLGPHITVSWVWKALKCLSILDPVHPQIL
jgi:hypothetical protein